MAEVFLGRNMKIRQCPGGAWLRPRLFHRWSWSPDLVIGRTTYGYAILRKRRICKRCLEAQSWDESTEPRSLRDAVIQTPEDR